MLLSNEDVERIKEAYDVYDLVELLDLTASDIIEAFDFKIAENETIVERITKG